MKLLLCGSTALESYKARKGTPLMDFTELFHQVSSYCPQLMIDLCSNADAQQYLADMLEYLYGSIVLYGSMVTDTLLDRGTDPVFVQDLEAPWKYQNTQLSQWITKQYHKSHKVYTDVEKLPIATGKALTSVTPMNFMYVVAIKHKKKEDNQMPSIEESIRAAMIELGITDAAGAPLPPKAATPQPEAAPTPKPAPAPAPAPKAPKAPSAAPSTPRKQSPAPPQEKTQQKETPPPTAAETAPEYIYTKIKDGHLALIFPQGLQLKQEIIAGTKVDVVTVAMPDWTNDKLQSLAIIAPQEAPQPVKRVPITTPPEQAAPAPTPKPKAPKPTMEIGETMDELLVQKQDLTSQIAAARAAGDEQLVNELRKQRRVVRGKINQLKE